jgi:hypothetical protein
MMKIAATQSGSGPRQIAARPARRREKAASEAAARGKIRHVLHGWRILLAPLVAQVLERAGGQPALVPVDYALGAYRRRQADPPALRLLRDI